VICARQRLALCAQSGHSALLGSGAESSQIGFWGWIVPVSETSRPQTARRGTAVLALDNWMHFVQSALVEDRRRPLLLVRRGRFLSPNERLRYRLYRMRTGNVFASNAGADLADGLLVLVVAYGVRLVTLPIAIIGDWIAMPVLQRIDRSDKWWVVEVRFDGWDAEFVRIAEASSEVDARRRMSEIENA
jgi:hypothetical protein